MISLNIKPFYIPHRFNVFEDLIKFNGTRQIANVELSEWTGSSWNQDANSAKSPTRQFDMSFYPNGMVAEIKNRNPYSIDTVTFDYDDTKRLKRIMQSNDRQKQFATEFWYDDEGGIYPDNHRTLLTYENKLLKRQKEMHVNEYGIVEIYEDLQYEYDSLGRVTRRDEYAFPTKEDDSGYLVDITEGGLQYLFYSIWDYTKLDNNHLQITETSHDFQDQSSRTTISIYDAYENIISRKSYTDNEKPAANAEFEYEYDVEGNWTKYTYIVNYEELGRITTQIIERKINYSK